MTHSSHKGRRASKRGSKQNGSHTRSAPRQTLSGTLQVTTRGYGFVSTVEGEYFIPRGKIGGAMDGDTVEIAAQGRGNPHDAGRPSGSGTSARHDPIGRVVHVSERAHDTLVGRYEDNGTFGFVIPDDPRIGFDVFVNPLSGTRAHDGDIVIVRITSYPARHEGCIGTIEKVVGAPGKPGVDMETVIAQHGLETEFSRGSLEQAEAVRVDVARALQEKDRRDCRGRSICTIDPADARDFDDALSLERIEGRGGVPVPDDVAATAVWRLGVHIADVSSYVPWGSSIDLDARRRATSVYLPDRVIPMLPEELSCDVCSLKPGADRLAFTADLFLDSYGNVVFSEMYPSVIRSRLRLDYGSLQKVFDGDESFGTLIADARSRGDAADDIDGQAMSSALTGLLGVSRALRAQRLARGALDFETVEAKVELDGDGEPAAIVLRHRCDATELVEECMIAANEAVAHFMLQAEAPCVYRVHEEPKRASLEDLAPVLREFGYAREGAPVTPQAIQEVLREVKGRPEEELVDSLLLRAMKRAEYRPEFTTHFGLASTGYTHFTSPIRRYPDLLVHRLLRAQLVGGIDHLGPDADLPRALQGAKGIPDQLEWLCEHSSNMEREADAAALEAVQRKICLYMQRFVGQEFEGLITGVLGFGFFVRLDIGAEGLVARERLSDDLVCDIDRHAFTTEVGKNVYRLGQRVRVRLLAVDLEKWRIDFALA